MCRNLLETISAVFIADLPQLYKIVLKDIRPKDEPHQFWMIVIVVAIAYPKYAVKNSVGSKGEVFRVTSGTPGEVATTR